MRGRDRVKRKRVVVMDRDLENRLDLQQRLEDRGYVTAGAGDRKEAFRLVRRIHPDLVIWEPIPEGEAAETLREIRRATGNAGPRLISMSPRRPSLASRRSARVGPALALVEGRAWSPASEPETAPDDAPAHDRPRSAKVLSMADFLRGFETGVEEDPEGPEAA